MIFYGSKIEVNVVTDLGDSKYGVIIEDNRNMYKYISKIIDSTIHRLPMPRKIRVNDFCLAMFGDEIWHRARVTHTNPLTVYFLDFANEEECTLEYLRIIPKDLEDHELEDVEEELMFLTKIPPLAFKIQTEQYVTLEEGSLAKIVLQEEIEHNHWMVAIIREKDRHPPNSSKRLEIVADPQHVEKHMKKKKNKAPEVQKPSNVGYTSASAPSKGSSATSRKLQDEIISLSEDDSDVEFVSEHKMSNINKQNAMRGDKSSLVYSAVCHQPEFDNIPPPNAASRRAKPIVISDESEPEFDNIPPPPSLKIKHDARQKQVVENNDKRDDHIAKRLGKLSIANGLSGIETKLIYDSFTSWPRDYFVDYLKPGDQLAFIVHESCSNNEYCGMMICKRLERQIDALDDLDSLTPQKRYRAKRGTFVATFLNPFHQWYRGYVVSEPTNTDPTYLLILFDIGIMYRTSDVTPLPERFLNVPLLAVRCTIPSFPSDYNEMYRLEVLPMTKTLTEVELFLQDKCIYTGIVKGRENSEIECDLQPKIGTIKIPIKVKFAPWVPTKEEMGVDCVQLKNGDVVKISAISVTNECYVVPVNEEFNEERNKFLDSVVLHCRKAKSIDHEPKIREIVGVPHIRTFWRGQVIERKKNSFTVHLLDIGADIRVLKEDMKELPDALKFVNSYAACVLLDKMQRTDFDKRSEDFLKYVVTHEKKFIVEIDQSSSLVNLKFAEEIECRKWKMRKGSSFNETMNDMLKPLWKLSDSYDFGSLFFLSNFKFEEWEVGSILSLLFVEKLDPKNGTFINPRGDVYAKLVEVNLTLRLTEYAEEKAESYVPISNELCVAKYDDGLWYRAVCVSAEPGKDLQLQFIDIGYQRPVPHFNIRRISPDFLKHPAAALFCEITNCNETDDLSQLEGRMLRRCKVIERIEVGGYALEVENLDSYLCSQMNEE